jgi:hypothetical protein
MAAPSTQSAAAVSGPGLGVCLSTWGAGAGGGGGGGGLRAGEDVLVPSLSVSRHTRWRTRRRLANRVGGRRAGRLAAAHFEVCVCLCSCFVSSCWLLSPPLLGRLCVSMVGGSRDAGSNDESTTGQTEVRQIQSCRSIREEGSREGEGADPGQARSARPPRGHAHGILTLGSPPEWPSQRAASSHPTPTHPSPNPLTPKVASGGGWGPPRPQRLTQ